MGAGRKRKRVTFQETITVADGGGGFDTIWTKGLTVSGEFKPERGGERLAAGRTEATVSGILEVRASSELSVVSEAWRVLIDDIPYTISSITNPDQRGRFLEIVVQRGGATDV